MTTQEIESKIQTVTAKQNSATEEIDSLRKERAKLALYGKGLGNSDEIGRVDHKIFKLELSLSNAPAELELLEKQLVAERQRLAQQEKDKLIEQQKKAATEVENLSKKFVVALENANTINNQLRNALTAETALREKTGKTILENWCNPSIESLQRLLETCEAQLDTGVHTHPCGPGIVRSATPLML